MRGPSLELDESVRAGGGGRGRGHGADQEAGDDKLDLHFVFKGNREIGKKGCGDEIERSTEERLEKLESARWEGSRA